MRAAFIVLVLAATVTAEPRRAGLKHVEPIIERSAQGTTTQVAYKKLVPQVIDERSASAFVIAAVGSSPGNGGTYFRSEVTLVNNRDIQQRIAIFYLPASGGCENVKVQYMNLAAGSWYGWSDFLVSVYGISSFGSLVVFAIDSAGNYDSNGAIDGFSRIWTPVPGFKGTASQSFPPTALTSYEYGQVAYGLRHEADFRTNIVLMNYIPSGSTEYRNFYVYVGGIKKDVEYEVAVPPCGLVIQTIPAGDYGPLAIYAEPYDYLGGWYGLGSTIDNNNGDSWSSAMRP